MRVKLDLTRREFEGLKELLYTCSDFKEYVLLDGDLAEYVLKQLEELED